MTMPHWLRRRQPPTALVMGVTMPVQRDVRDVRGGSQRGGALGGRLPAGDARGFDTAGQR